jgi:hypothetical protein
MSNLFFVTPFHELGSRVVLPFGLDLGLDLDLGFPFNPRSLYEKPCVSMHLVVYLILYWTGTLNLVLVLA